MRVPTITFSVAMAMALMVSSVAEAAEMTGFITDKLCLSNCQNSTMTESCTPDDANVVYGPQEHTGWCMLLEPCVNSGYVLLSAEPTGDNGKHTVLLDLDNEDSHETVVSFMERSTAGPVPLATIEYNEDTVELVNGVPHVHGVTIRDPWESTAMATDDSSQVYLNPDAQRHMVLCKDSTSADLIRNNMCLRSDIVVTEDMTEDGNFIMSIESNGCPDHANMQGSSGRIVDPNPQAAAYHDQGCCATCGGCCGTTATCGGCDSCCAGCDSCSAGCDSCSAGCDSCSAGCDSCSAGCDACSAGCDSCSAGEEATAIARDSNQRFLQNATGCDASCCSAGCDASCSAGCDAISCSSASCASGCSAGCDSCCSGAGCGSCCSAGCGSCCSASCGGCCGASTTATNGQGHGSKPGPYSPMFQHYRMVFPSNPAAPGEAKYFSDDDVVGILVNGVLLDSHKPTWSYDSCNGHSDKKHQYHYHIPPLCFLQAMGVTTPDETFWWMSNATHVREYDDMAAQWPSMGDASPIIGYARDGFPIFGPYDDAGRLQRGNDFGGDVDECNGKMDSNGNYGYYLTVDPPFAPPCLKGEKGLFSYYTTDKTCPTNGIQTTVVDASSIDACAAARFEDAVACVEENTAEDGDSGAAHPLAGSAALVMGAAAAVILGQQL